MVVLVLMVAYSRQGKHPPTPTAREVAQNQCATVAMTAYIREKAALLQQPSPVVVPTVEQIIAGRRLQEQFCVQFAKCLATGDSAQLVAVYSAMFSSCLRDEALEEYDAVLRD
ncbi:MAG TPA: hypothetical protein VN808_08545 [Stellaceae bacterium]|nr:hypothetical protein [Stellaceae bacterium]